MQIFARALIVVSLVISAPFPAGAATPPYWYANHQCPASRPWLIGYARFTNAPVCTDICKASIQCWDGAGASYYPSQRRSRVDPKRPRVTSRR